MRVFDAPRRPRTSGATWLTRVIIAITLITLITVSCTA